jgi:hypothetical protein
MASRIDPAYANPRQNLDALNRRLHGRRRP